VRKSAPLELTIAPDHPAFAGHFPGNPIVPGVVLLDRVLQAICGRERLNPSRLEIHAAKFHASVRPGEPLFFTYHGSGGVDGKFAFEIVTGANKAASGSFSAGSAERFESPRGEGSG
jgi:3-hydroxymyristoyl/3-hydroxydecanoyl-(acyl carrier protein) dehydratase